MKKLEFIVKLIFLVLCWNASAAFALDYGLFRQIPVLHEGRLKPLESFARAQLYALHGSESLDGRRAVDWLAESLFDPGASLRKPFIRMATPGLAALLGINYEKGKLYTYAEIAPLYAARTNVLESFAQKNQVELSGDEKAFLELYAAMENYSELLRALSTILMVSNSIDEDYYSSIGIKKKKINFIDLIPFKDRILLDAKAAADRHGENLAAYSNDELQAMKLAFYFTNMQKASANNALFRVIPAFLSDARQWYAPWALLNEGHGSPQGAELLSNWASLAEAYRADDALAWKASAEAIMERTVHARDIADWQLSLEVWYQRLSLSLIAMGMYFLALLAFATSFASARIPLICGKTLLTIGFFAHTTLILMRIAILMRPPVSTLYESILFVAWVAVLATLYLARKAKFAEGLPLAALLGFGLLAISGVFSSGGDTLQVVIAVLNTNFWLATHVICITIGYACCALAGTCAHLYLFRLSDSVRKLLQPLALIALFFTAIGTVLGGIWADQSWGRFWGWDPKENGALLIVLWLVWLLHGKIAGQLKSAAFAATLAFVNVIVAISWFGVNLLSTGLHAYGFTNEAAYGLAAFCAAEIIAIALLAKRAEKKRSA